MRSQKEKQRSKRLQEVSLHMSILKLFFEWIGHAILFGPYVEQLVIRVDWLSVLTVICLYRIPTLYSSLGRTAYRCISPSGGELPAASSSFAFKELKNELN